MDRSEAAALLGVPAGASDGELRDAYRTKMRAQHPDVAGPASTGDAARINAAYAVLRGSAAIEATPVPPVTADPTGDEITLVDDETMAFAFPADEVFQLLVDVADRIGDITYVDPEAGLLETRVQFVGEPACSVVLTLQGRADRVEAFCSIESLDGTRPPPTSDVVSLLVRSLRDRLAAHRSR